MSIVTRNFTIPAGEEIKIARQADFVRCLDATATITVQFDNGDMADLATGLSYSPEGGFKELTVLNGTANPVTVKLNLGKGQMADNRASVNTSQIMPTRESAPDTVHHGPFTIPAATLSTVLPANPLRNEAWLTNNGPGDAFLFNTHAMKAGDVFIVSTTAAIQVYSTAGTEIVWSEFAWSA